MIKVLSNSYTRATGAMFMPSLGENVFAFVYPELSNRMFITWFCPPLRILCFDDNGALVFDQVIDKWKLIKLPVTRLILELDPDFCCGEVVREIARLGLDKWVSKYYPNSRVARNVGGTRTDDPYGDLLLRLIAESLSELKSVREIFDGEKTFQDFEKLPLWRRGQIVSAASFVLDLALDVPYNIPSAAMSLSKKLIQVTEVEGKNKQSELFAAAVAGVPWRFDPIACFRCGEGSSWRQIFKPSEMLPKASQWRLARPENHIPICGRCWHNADLLDNSDLMIALGYAYWGSRFSAFHRWFNDAEENILPCNWNLDDYPLWPDEYGGDTWAKGSGAIQHCAPRVGKVVRKSEHLQIARRAFRGKHARWNGSARQGELYSLLYG